MNVNDTTPKKLAEHLKDGEVVYREKRNDMEITRRVSAVSGRESLYLVENEYPGAASTEPLAVDGIGMLYSTMFRMAPLSEWELVEK